MAEVVADKPALPRDCQLDCCPPQFADVGPTAPLAAGPANTVPYCGLASDSTSQQAPLSAFQALIDAAIKDQAVPRVVGPGPPIQPSRTSYATGSHGFSAPAFHPSPQLSIPAPSSAPRAGEVPCLWTGCEEVFPNVDLLLDHFRTTASHIPFPNALGIDQPFNAGAIQAQQLFQGAAAQQMAQQQQRQQQQATDDAKATQDILDFFCQSSVQDQPAPMSAQPIGVQPSAQLPPPDPFSVQCQWGGQPHTFTLADLLPSAPTGSSQDVSMTTETATLSPTNLFLKHLMEDHLAGNGPGGLNAFPPQSLQIDTTTPAIAVTPGLLGDDASSVFSAGGGAGLAAGEWSASTPHSSASTAGTPTSLDSGAFTAGMLHAHNHMHHHPLSGLHHHHNIHQYSPLHQPQQHQFFYVPQHVHHAHLHTQLSPHAHAHPQHQHGHAHSHHGSTESVFAMQPPPGLQQHQHQHQQHHCSIDSPSGSSTRPGSSASTSQPGRNAGRHHPYRAPTTSDVPSPASTSASGNHLHVHHLPHSHHKHNHSHAHSRHLLPSIKHRSGRSSISSMGEVAQSQGGSPVDGAPAPSVHACGWPGCRLVFDDTAALTDHLDKVHVGSGKNQYSCGWDGCDRALHGREPFG